MGWCQVQVICRVIKTGILSVGSSGSYAVAARAAIRVAVNRNKYPKCFADSRDVLGEAITLLSIFINT